MLPCSGAGGQQSREIVEIKEPYSQRQIGGLHDRPCREGGLMAAGSAMVGLVTPAVDEIMRVGAAAVQ
jgi:hypothetical protein